MELNFVLFSDFLYACDIVWFEGSTAAVVLGAFKTDSCNLNDVLVIDLGYVVLNLIDANCAICVVLEDTWKD